jgi:hypothetical protein
MSGLSVPLVLLLLEPQGHKAQLVPLATLALLVPKARLVTL